MPLDSHAPRLPTGAASSSVGPSSADWLTFAATRFVPVARSYCQIRAVVAAGSVGVLRIGFTAASAFDLMGTVLNRIAEAMPEVSVEVKEMARLAASMGRLAGKMIITIDSAKMRSTR